MHVFLRVHYSLINNNTLSSIWVELKMGIFEILIKWISWIIIQIKRGEKINSGSCDLDDYSLDKIIGIKFRIWSISWYEIMEN